MDSYKIEKILSVPNNECYSLMNCGFIDNVRSRLSHSKTLKKSLCWNPAESMTIEDYVGLVGKNLW